MEDSAAPKVENNVDQMSGYFIKIENTAFVTPTRQNTIIKYTKLPEYELHSKGKRTLFTVLLFSKTGIHKVVVLDSSRSKSVS